MSRHIILHIIIAFTACMTAFSAHSAKGPALTVRAQADSTTLIMGDQTVVNVEILKNGHNGTFLDMPKPETDYYGLDMIEYTTDSTDLGNNRIELKYRIIFQAFDPSELVTLPPFRYAQDGDTAQSDILTFKVLPVDLSPELGSIENIDSLTIHPDAPPFAIKSKWYDAIPNWSIWTILGLLLCGAIAYALFLLYKKNGPKLFVPQRIVSPYELAMQRLDSLKQKRLLEKGQPKQFYTEVVDILRHYLEGRFGIYAMEMTSKQILRKIRENKEIHLSAGQIEQTLQLADIVKFAAQNPTQDEGMRTYNTIYQFIESTRPQTETDEANNQQATKSEPSAKQKA